MIMVSGVTRAWYASINHSISQVSLDTIHMTSHPIEEDIMRTDGIDYMQCKRARARTTRRQIRCSIKGIT